MLPHIPGLHPCLPRLNLLLPGVAEDDSLLDTRVAQAVQVDDGQRPKVETSVGGRVPQLRSGTRLQLQPVQVALGEALELLKGLGLLGAFGELHRRWLSVVHSLALQSLLVLGRRHGLLLLLALALLLEAARGQP